MLFFLKKYSNRECMQNPERVKRTITIKDLLKPEVIEILNDPDNYLSNYDPTSKLRCKYCNKRLEKRMSRFKFWKKEKPIPILPLILWHKDQEHYIVFHFRCAFQLGKVDDFNEIAGIFDYTYDANKNKAYFI